MSKTKVVRFEKMTVVIPLKDGETPEDIEDKLIDAVESVGSRFTSYKLEVTEEDDV